MSFVKCIATNFVAAVAVFLGMGVAGTIWENGLEEIVDEKTKKFFSKKES